MADEWKVDTSMLNSLIEKLEQAEASTEAVARKAINAATPILKASIRKHMPRSKTPRTYEYWRTGNHAADEIKITGFKTSWGRSNDGKSLYKVVGARGKGKHFYMKFFEYGRNIYSPGKRYFVGYQPPDSFMTPAVDSVRNEVIGTMREMLIKELEIYGNN